MRKSHFIRIISLLTLCLVAKVSAGSLQDLDKKNGFRDAKLGMPIDSLRGLSLIQDGSSLKNYARKSDTLKIGDIDLNSIHYFYYKGRLDEVYISFNKTNRSYLTNIFSAAYGQPTQQVGKSSDTYFSCCWIGKKVRLCEDVDYLDTNFAGISFKSIQLEKQIQNDFKKTVNESKKSDDQKMDRLIKKDL